MTAPAPARPRRPETPGVYRMYDSGDRALYIGVGRSPAARIAMHAATKPWFTEVTRIQIDWYPDRVSASAAEGAAIEAEQPWYCENGVNRPHIRYAVSPDRVQVDRSHKMTPTERVLMILGRLRREAPGVYHGRREINRRIASSVARGQKKTLPGGLCSTILRQLATDPSSPVQGRVISINPVSNLPTEGFRLP